MNQSKDNPLVTVSMSSYNNSSYVLETLNSIANQTYDNIELVIIDDCSTDNSVLLIDEWLKTFTRPYIFVKNEINKGVCAVANSMLENANGRYFSMIASDDLILPNKIEEQLNFIAKFDEKVGLVYGDCEFIDNTGKTIRGSNFSYRYGNDFVPPSGKIFQYIVKDFFFYLHTCLIDLRLLRQIGFTFDQNIISEDWDIQLALSRRFEVHGLNRIYAKYRILPNSVTANNWSSDKMYLVQKSHFNMFLKYVEQSSNNSKDKTLLLIKIRDVYWQFFSSDNSKYKDKLDLYFKIFTKSKLFKDLLVLIFVLFNLIPLLNIYRKVKTKLTSYRI